MFHRKKQAQDQESANLNLVVDTMLDQKQAAMESAKEKAKPAETRKQRRQRKKVDRILRKKSRKLIIPRSVQEAIPYKRVYPDTGLIETQDGIFVRCYILGDINYSMFRKEEQEDIIEKYGELLNSLDCVSHFQILAYQQMRNKEEFEKLVLLNPGADELTHIRVEHNTLMKEEIRKGRNEMHIPKYLCVEMETPDYETACNAFIRLDHEIAKNVKTIGGSYATPLSASEYLELLYNIYNPTQVGTFGNQMELDANGNLKFSKEKFSFEIMERMGLTTKDVVGPESFGFPNNTGKTGDVFFRSLFIKSIPSKMKDFYMEKLTEVNCKMLISLQYQPIDMNTASRMVKNDLRSIQSNLIDRQKAATQAGYSTELLPSEMKDAYAERELIREALSSKAQKLFNLTIVITHFADTLDQLDEDTKAIEALGQSEFLTIRPLTGQELFGWNASLPLCCNSLQIRRTILTRGAAMLIPFSCQDVMDLDGGICYGKNMISQNLILFNRRKGKNGNAFIIGVSGSGKSVMAKLEMENVIISSQDHVIVIDPDGEYQPLANRLGGEIVRLGTDSRLYINPLDISITDSVEKALGEKSDLICSMFEAIFGENAELTAQQSSIIDICVEMIYQPYLESMNPVNGRYNMKKMPTLVDLYQVLRNQDSMDAMILADALQRYAVGTQNFFAHHTNVRYHSRFVVYDIKDLGDSMKALGELVVLNAVWNEICRGRKQGRRTWFYIDEIHLLLQNPRSTAFLRNLYKRARKFGGLPTGISQNISDIIYNPTAQTMISNSEFIILMGQSDTDIEALQYVFKDISDAQIQSIKNVPPGQGLIFDGKNLIPFINEIPKDSNLYQALTTTLTEVAGLDRDELESEDKADE